MLALRELQTRFFHSIADAPGAGPSSFDPALIACVESRGRLGASERIDIYAQMYFARLADALQTDFPRVAALLGCERFHSIAADYLARHPSTHPSLRYLGRHFAPFLRTNPEVSDLPFLSDLAALEWARLDVFDAPESRLLRIEHLQRIAPEQWPALRLQTIPAFQLVRLDWPAHDVWQAVEEWEGKSEGRLQSRPTVLKVWREEFSVYHAALETPERLALERVQAGAPFAEVCATLESVLPAEEAAPMVGSLLLRWIEDGILVELPEC